MIKVNIICVGSIKEKFFTQAVEEYMKRLSRFCSLNIVEVQEEASEKSVSKKIEKESNKLINALKGVVFLLDRQGQMISSEGLAESLDKVTSQGASEVSFVIGGSNGVSEALKEKSKHIISFGKVTYPHQLFRVVLLEQIYRAFTINSNLPYHK